MVLLNDKNVVGGIFPNKEKKYIDLKDVLYHHNVFTLIFEDNSDIFDLMIMKKWVDDFKYKTSTCTLKLYFCPYGQTDRKMGDSIFSFKYFAQIINSLNFDRIRIYDPHSPVMEGILERCEVFYPMLKIKLNDYDLLFYPDNGAAKKYSEIYEKPYRFGNKKRNLDTGEIIRYEVIADKKEIAGKKILIRDDLCMGGRTFKEAAKALIGMGAVQIDLYVTHLMPQAEEFYKNHENYGITNFYSENTLNQKWYNTQG